MATFLDIGLAQHFGVIFPILFVFVVIFALLEKTKLLGENKGLHSLIALSVAMMMLFVQGVIAVFAIIAPWFVLIMLISLLFMLLLLLLGVKMETIVTDMSGDWGAVHWVYLIVGLIVFIGALGAVYGGSLLPYSGSTVEKVGDGTSTDTGDFNANVGRVIFHPKVLGLIFLLLIGALAMKLLAGKN